MYDELGRMLMTAKRSVTLSAEEKRVILESLLQSMQDSTAQRQPGHRYMWKTACSGWAVVLAVVFAGSCEIALKPSVNGTDPPGVRQAAHPEISSTPGTVETRLMIPTAWNPTRFEWVQNGSGAIATPVDWTYACNKVDIQRPKPKDDTLNEARTRAHVTHP